MVSNPRNAGGGAFERVSGWTTSARATDASAPRHTSYGHRPRDRHVASALSEDGIDDDDVDDADDDEEMSFGDIDRLASAAESKRRAGDTGTDTGVVAANPGKNDLVEFGLTGRPLFVCQSIWWLRLSQLKTYPPNDSEVRDVARRSGLSTSAVERWFNDALDNYHNLSLADKATYDIECQAKLDKLEELTVKLGEKDPGAFIGRDDDPVNTYADWNEYGKLTDDELQRAMDRDPLYIAMNDLPGVMAAEAAAKQLEKDTEEALDDEAIERIPQDGSEEKPYLVNPYTFSKSGTWSTAKKVGPPDEREKSTEWIEDGGWNVLPNDELVSAVDGKSLNFVGVNNDVALRDMWKYDRPFNRESLEEAVEVPSSGLMREAKSYLGDKTRTTLSKLAVGTELQGTVVALELYHGALVDCGCETDGLIKISESDWLEVRDALPIGAEVKVKVSAVHQKFWRYRFPIELQILEPNVGHLIEDDPHPYGAPINIYSGETVPYAFLDAGRSIDLYVQALGSKTQMEAIQELMKNRKESNEHVFAVASVKTKTQKKGKKQRERMQKLLEDSQRHVDKSAALRVPDDEDDDTAPMAVDGGAAAAVDTPFDMRDAGEKTESMIAAEEEEEEAALFMTSDTVNAKPVDPDAVEEGDDDEEIVVVDGPEAEDVRGGLSGITVDDVKPMPGDLDDDDDDIGDDDEDDIDGVPPKSKADDDDADEIVKPSAR